MAFLIKLNRFFIVVIRVVSKYFIMAVSSLFLPIPTRADDTKLLLKENGKSKYYLVFSHSYKK